jgi:hypothetical protein
MLYVPNMPSDVVRLRLNEAVTVSKLIILVAPSVFSAAMISIFAVVASKLRLSPDGKVLLNFFVASILFLVLSHLYTALAQILGWLSDSHFLMREIPNRLTGVQYLISIICIVFFLQSIITKALKNSAYANKIRMMGLMIFLLIVGAWINHYRTVFLDIPRIMRDFFAKEDCVLKDVHKAHLDKLNPKLEAEFFYSLAEYLFEKSEKKH